MDLVVSFSFIMGMGIGFVSYHVTQSGCGKVQEPDSQGIFPPRD
jgi:hypothetical protein